MTALAYPGTSMSLGGFTQNVLATFTTEGPAAVILTMTVAQTGTGLTQGIAVMSASDVYDFPWDSAFPNLPDRNTFAEIGPSGMLYGYRVPYAGTWYVVGCYGEGYISDLDGAGTFVVLTPGTGSALAFPGTLDVTVQNELASVATSGPVVVFVTIDSDLPSDYYLGVYGSTTGDHYLYATGVPFPAGTYVYITDDADATLQVYAYLAGVYDAGLTDTGTYEVVTT